MPMPAQSNTKTQEVANESSICPPPLTSAQEMLLARGSHSSHFWLRSVDDIFIIQQAKHSQQLLQHINSQDPHIQFTTEDPYQEGALLFLDTLVSPRSQQPFSNHSIQKPTNMDQYLNLDSNHYI